MFSVIIPVKNDVRLFDCLASIYRQGYPSDLFEVIVIEDGSNHFEKKISALAHPNLRYYSSAGGGSFSARNVGIQKAKFEVCAFVDSDCEVGPDWLKSAATYHKNNPDHVFGGRIKLSNDFQLNLIEMFESLFYLNQQAYLKMYGFLVTANFFCSCEYFGKIGLFQGVSNAEEEKEFCWRVSSHNIPLSYCCDVVVSHPIQSRLLLFIKRISRDFLAQKLLKKTNPNYNPDLTSQKIMTLKFYIKTIIQCEASVFRKIQLLCLLPLIITINLMILLLR